MSVQSKKKSLNTIRPLNKEQPQIVTPRVGVLFSFFFPQSNPCYKTLGMISLHFYILCRCFMHLQMFDLMTNMEILLRLKKETLSSL